MNHPELNAAEADVIELYGRVRPDNQTLPQHETTATSSAPAEETTINKPSSASAADDVAKQADGKKQPSSIYDHVDHSQQEPIRPFSKDYIGVLANYLSVGLMLGGSTSILYPILVVREGVTPSLLTASTSLVTVFWSYKILFGFLSDCFPLLGFKRKPYICLGWTLCALFLLALAREGHDVLPHTLVLYLTLANCGYVMADVCADGFMVWIAHRERIEQRGRMQTLIYATNSLGQILINILILLGFSGPRTNCPGYEPDPAVPCTQNPRIAGRNDLSSSFPDEWCHLQCENATFFWDLSIPAFALIIALVNLSSIPLYVILKEERTPPVAIKKFLQSFWEQIQRRALWQILLYSMVSHITFGVENAAKTSANYVLLDLHTSQYQIMILMEKCIFFLGLTYIRKYALHMSWRKMMIAGSTLVTLFNCLYFLIIYDVLRSPSFYIFTDVSSKFIYTLNFLASLFCMVEVAEPGYEAITYSLITTAGNAVSPLSSVISYQLLSFFPELATQESIAADTPQVRHEFGILHAITIAINLTSLLSLPLLPRQKKETRELVASGEKSKFWGLFALLSGLTFLIYSTIVTFVTVALHDVYGCFMIFGGTGCSAEESPVAARFLVVVSLLYCYLVNFYFSYLPILRGKKRSLRDLFL